MAFRKVDRADDIHHRRIVCDGEDNLVLLRPGRKVTVQQGVQFDGDVQNRFPSAYPWVHAT